MLQYPVPFINLEYVFYKIYLFLTSGFSTEGFYERFVDLSAAFFPYSTIISLLFLVGIIYCFMRFREIEHSMMISHEVVHAGPVTDMPNKRWVRIVSHLNSENESDWRLAILEADLILEEMLHSMGYPGETIGEKLKGIERSDFNSIDDAWEAHKIRNQIAHEGGDFRLNNREARRVVSLYEKVFKEFRFI